MFHYELEYESSEKLDIPDEYYESKLEFGPKRLVENIRESSFFTFMLSKAVSTLFSIITSVGFLFSIIGYVLIVNQTGSELISPVSRAFVLGLTFWVCGDFLSLAIKYNKTFRSAESIYGKASELLKHTELSENEALILFGEYNCVMISANPIPNWIFKLKRSRLNKAWSARKLAN